MDNNVNNIYKKLIKLLSVYGRKHDIKNNTNQTIELEDVWITLTNIHSNVITCKHRNISMEYLKGEIEWFMHGTYNVNEIAKYSKFWLKIATNNHVNSNYGLIALREIYNGYSQFGWCLDTLSKDHESRKAIINYNQPRHKYKDNRDFPCCMTQQFRIIDQTLISKVFMRANDLIYGFTYNIYWFTELQKILYNALKQSYPNLKLGKLIYYASSMRIYKIHFGFLE
jgi:thymidylate synthase